MSNEQIGNNFNNKKVIKKSHKMHLKFEVRLIVNFVVLTVLIIFLIKFLLMSFSITKDEIITYSEKSNIDYKVRIKENDFYDEMYLDKGMAYVASLIDNICVNYNYIFTTNKESDIDLTYKIVAKLIISSQNNSNIFYEKEYDLTDEISEEMINKKEFLINKSVDIDYVYYNSLANKFKSNYAVNTDSSLEVYLQVKEKNKESNSYELNNQSKTLLNIPLSEQEISINIDNKNINEEKQIVSDSKFVIKNVLYLIISFILFIFVIIFLYLIVDKILLLFKKMSPYDRCINKIIRCYDRLIVNVKNAPNLRGYNVVKVENFEELVDVRDNTKEPIRYLNIIDHKKCIFFLTNHADLYLLEFDAEDFNGDANHESK